METVGMSYKGVPGSICDFPGKSIEGYCLEKETMRTSCFFDKYHPSMTFNCAIAPRRGNAGPTITIFNEDVLFVIQLSQSLQNNEDGKYNWGIATLLDVPVQTTSDIFQRPAGHTAEA